MISISLNLCTVAGLLSLVLLMIVLIHLKPTHCHAPTAMVILRMLIYAVVIVQIEYPFQIALLDILALIAVLLLVELCSLTIGGVHLSWATFNPEGEG
jgi:hypothetical protein